MQPQILKTLVLWSDRVVTDTLLEVQIFDSEEEARRWLRECPHHLGDSYPKLVPNIPVSSPFLLLENLQKTALSKGQYGQYGQYGQ